MTERGEKKKSKRTPMVFLAVVGGCLFFLYLTRPLYTGFCFSQLRYLSNDELIRIALKKEALSSTAKSEEFNAISRMTIQPDDEGVRAFLEANPNCCRVGNAEYAFFFRRMVNVLVFYEINQKHKNANYRASKYYESYRLMGSCGEIYRQYGTATNVIPYELSYSSEGN